MSDEKEKAYAQLVALINQLPLKKQDYDSVINALDVLADK